jgi:hypothetical protein
MMRKPYLFPLLLFLFALASRAAAVLVLRDPHAAPTLSQMGLDAVQYNMFGANVASGRGYSWEDGTLTSFCAPGFPLLLAGIYALFGQKYVLVYAALCLLGALACLLTYFIARDLLSDERTARVAGLLAAVYVPHIYFATEFATENVFAACLALAVWGVLRHLKSGSQAALLVAGLALGWGILTRPFALLLLPLFAAILLHRLWKSQPPRSAGAWLAPIILIVATIGVVAPWTIRNYAVHHRFVAVATNGGVTFYGGNNDRVLREPRHWGGWIPSTQLPGRAQIEAAPDEIARDKMQWDMGRRWLREHLAYTPALAAFKFARMWLPDVDSANRKYVLLQLVTYTPFLLLFLIAVVHLIRRGPLTYGWAVVHGCVLATVAVGLIFWGAPRFRDANAPLLALYAAVGVRAMSRKFTPRRTEIPTEPALVPLVDILTGRRSVLTNAAHFPARSGNTPMKIHVLSACLATVTLALLVTLFVARRWDRLADLDEGSAMAAAPAATAPTADRFPVAGVAATQSSDRPADLYVAESGSDRNPGTAAAPFRTLQHAADVVKPGQTVRVRPGKYAGMNFYRQSGGAPGRPIRFLADPGAVINSSAKAGSNNNSGINLEPGKGWFVFAGFHIVNADGSMERACIRVSGNSNVQILANTCEKGGTWGIISSLGDDVLIQGNLCANAAGEHGLYVGRGSKRVTVRGNIFRDNNCDGLHLNGGGDGPIDAALVEGNVIYGNQLTGIDADGVRESVFRNNLVYGNGKHAVTLYNHDTAVGTTGNLFVNNTLVAARMFAVQMRPGSTRNRFYNNILLQSTERAGYGTFGTGGAPAGLTSDYNVVVDRFSTDLGVGRMTKAEWTTLTDQDRHSVTATASQVFANPAADDYRLKSRSPAIGVGVPPPGPAQTPTDDLLGRPRGPAPVAGAYAHRPPSP